jgi:hypothetical protein
MRVSTPDAFKGISATCKILNKNTALVEVEMTRQHHGIETQNRRVLRYRTTQSAASSNAP